MIHKIAYLKDQCKKTRVFLVIMKMQIEVKAWYLFILIRLEKVKKYSEVYFR